MAMENLDSNLINEEPLEEKYLKLKERLEKEDLDLQKLREIVKNISSQQVIENPNLPLDIQSGRLSEQEYLKEDYAAQKRWQAQKT